VKKVKIILASIGVIVGLTTIGFATGEIQALYNRTVGADISSSETDKFHKSKGYVDGMAQDLAKYKLQLAQTTDQTSRIAIVNYINQEFANYDENDIQNEDLRQFLIDVRNGNIK
jgi:hypothetical protein